MSKLYTHDFLFQKPVHYTLKGLNRKRMVTIVEYMNMALIPISLGLGGYRVYIAIDKDLKYETSRNTTQTLTGLAFTWTGGLIGASVGSGMGKQIDEVNGAAVGALVGGIIGAIGLSFPMGILFDKIGDGANYNIIRRNCMTCNVPFILRIYQGYRKTDKICHSCYKIELNNMYLFSSK